MNIITNITNINYLWNILVVENIIYSKYIYY